jgi:hypothetical protein
MKTKLSLFLSIGLLGLSAGIGPVSAVENAQFEPAVSESQDTIKRTTEPQGCFWLGRWYCA